MSFINIIVVDDHTIFRNGLRWVLSRFEEIEIIGEAANGEEFLRLLPENMPDLVLMDVDMPVMNGIEATKLAVEMYPDIKVIALSMYCDEKNLLNMIDVGAKGYLLKNVEMNELNFAINAVVQGKNYFSCELLPFLTKKITTQKENKKEIVRFTDREMEILQLIVEGLTTAQIAKKLSISKRTVDGHKAHMISKTQSHNVLNLLIYGIKNHLVEL